MNKDRLGAFTDAVIAIIMTILVLELEQPKDTTWSAVWAMRESFLPYIISFIALSILWNNHHHTFQVVRRIDGGVLWANSILLFFASLFPWVTKFVDNNLSKSVPETLYGVVFWFMLIFYFVLYSKLGKADPDNSKLKFVISRPKQIIFNLIIIPIALVVGNFIWPQIIILTSFLVMLTWIIPDRRVEGLNLTGDN